MKNNRVYYNFARSKARSLYYNNAQKTIPNYKKTNTYGNFEDKKLKFEDNGI